MGGLMELFGDFDMDQVRTTPNRPGSWPTSARYLCILTVAHGPACICSADLRPFSLQARVR